MAAVKDQDVPARLDYDLLHVAIQCVIKDNEKDEALNFLCLLDRIIVAMKEDFDNPQLRKLNVLGQVRGGCTRA